MSVIAEYETRNDYETKGFLGLIKKKSYGKIKQQYIKIDKDELHKKANTFRQVNHRFLFAITLASYSLRYRYQIYGSQRGKKHKEGEDTTTFFITLIGTAFSFLIGLVGIDALGSILGIYDIFGRQGNALSSVIYTPFAMPWIPPHSIVRNLNYDNLKTKIEEKEEVTSIVFMEYDVLDSKYYEDTACTTEKSPPPEFNQIDNLSIINYLITSVDGSEVVVTFKYEILNLKVSGEEKTYIILKGNKVEIDKYIENKLAPNSLPLYILKIKFDTDFFYRKLMISKYNPNDKDLTERDSKWYYIKTPGDNIDSNDDNIDEGDIGITPEQRETAPPNITYNTMTNSLKTSITIVTTKTTNPYSDIKRDIINSKFITDFNSTEGAFLAVYNFDDNEYGSINGKSYFVHYGVNSDNYKITETYNFSEEGSSYLYGPVSISATKWNLNNRKFLVKIVLSLIVGIHPILSFTYKPRFKIPENSVTKFLKISGKHLWYGWPGSSKYLKFQNRKYDSEADKIIIIAKKCQGIVNCTTTGYTDLRPFDRPIYIILSIIFIVVFSLSTFFSQYYLSSLNARLTKSGNTGLFYKYATTSEGLPTDLLI
jgi:hypothetical protein